MLPYLTNKVKKMTDTISVFDGLNNSTYKKENELVSCLNTSASNYPCLSVSKGRKAEIKCESTINGASSYGGLFYTATDNDTGKSYIYHGKNKTELPENEITSTRFFAGMSDNILIMPDTLEFDEGAMCEPVSVARHAILKLDIQKGDNIFISGAGPIGIVAAQWAKMFGAENVYFSDIDKRKIEFAQMLGFKKYEKGI